MKDEESRNKSDESDKQERRRVPRGQTSAAVQECFLACLKLNGTGTTDDVHDRLQIDPADCKQIGRAIGHLAQQGLIRRIDYRRSRRVTSHGRMINVWALAEQH